MDREEGGGILYIVATPIGNLDDISQRALSVLQQVDLIAAEDTRHTSRLLKQFGISTRQMSLHAFNEDARIQQVLDLLQEGASIALVSDAGTPLISDPGFPLVRSAREAGFRVSPVPGPCALVAALSAAGLPSDRFAFEGFLPARSGPRGKQLESLAKETRTLIFYESPHRITDFLQDCARLFPGRRLVLARELTKTFETFLSGAPAELLEILSEDENQRRGEFVVVMEGASSQPDEHAVDAELLLKELLAELPVKKAAAIAARVTGQSKNDLYKQALALKDAS